MLCYTCYGELRCGAALRCVELRYGALIYGVPRCATLSCAVLCRATRNAVLGCAALYLAVLHCATLCSAALSCAEMCCAELRCAMLYYAVLC